MAQEIATWVLLVAMALGLSVGLAAGTMLTIRLYYANPVKAAELVAALLWIGMRVAKKYAPPIWRFLFKRMDPDTEARWRECQRRAGKWNDRTQQCE